MNLEPSEMTDRLLRALECPYIKVLGHPTGRMLLHRDSYPYDFEKVAKEASKRGVCMEINSSPERLDLSAPLIRQAKSHGIRFVVSTDAHHPKHLLNMPFGVATARRGWLTANDVINTLPRQEFENLIGARS
jgi:DNA polymerase (family 10)